MKHEYVYEAKLVRVIDGDTVVANIDLGFHTWIKRKIRFLGIDTPEIYFVRSEERERGVEAKEFVQGWFDELGDNFMIETFLDKNDKYGRVLAILYHIDKDGNERVLNQELLDNNLAEEYE